MAPEMRGLAPREALRVRPEGRHGFIVEGPEGLASGLCGFQRPKESAVEGRGPVMERGSDYGEGRKDPRLQRKEGMLGREQPCLGGQPRREAHPGLKVQQADLWEECGSSDPSGEESDPWGSRFLQDVSHGASDLGLRMH